MDEYLIGAGAVLTAGPESSISRATLHAQTDARLAAQVKAAVIDFEATAPQELSRIVIVAAGWARGPFESQVISKLLDRRECSLGAVIALLAQAAGTPEVHLFARWLPEAGTMAELEASNVRLVVHPLESIAQVALVSGQQFRRWRPTFRAA